MSFAMIKSTEYYNSEIRNAVMHARQQSVVG